MVDQYLSDLSVMAHENQELMASISGVEERFQHMLTLQQTKKEVIRKDL